MAEMPKHVDYKHPLRRLDWLSQNHPSKEYAKYPRDPNDISAGFNTVTYHDFAAAVTRSAQWLQVQLEPEDEYFAYWGPSDLRWSIFLMAGIKARKTMIHTSPWARLDGLLDMFDECGCSVAVCDSTKSCDAMAESPFKYLDITRPGFRTIEVPSLSDCLSSTETTVSSFEYTKCWNEAADEDVIAFHTSGTTGTPRLVKWSNRRIASWQSLLELAQQDLSVLVPDVMGRSVFNAFMPAHFDGHNFQLLMPLYFGNTVTLRHPGQTLQPEIVRQLIVHSSCTAILAPASLLAEIARCPRTLAVLRSLETLVVAGLGLTEECRGLISHPGVLIQNMHTHLETFPTVQKRQSGPDSCYVGFHPASGVSFRPHSSGRWELVVNQYDRHIDHQPVFTTWPHLHTYNTGQLYSTHPTSPGRWLFEGWERETIVLSTGAQVLVDGMERLIGKHPLVKSALVYGEAKPQPLLVIEPWSDVVASLRQGPYKDKFLDEIWSCIEEANATCTHTIQIQKRLTLVLETPVVKTAKNTIDRRRTLEMVQTEADALYEEYEDIQSESELQNVTVDIKKPPRTRGEEIRDNLRRLHAFREVNMLQW